MNTLRRKRAKAAILTLAAGVVFLGTWAFWIEPSRLVVRHQEIPWAPGPARGLRIALISDLHVGSPHIPLQKLRAVVEAINRESPDLVLIAGDLVVGGVPGGAFVDPETIAGELKHLRARLGVAAVLGNHDYARNAARVTSALEGIGITVLGNDALRIEDGSGSFWVAGLEDLWLGDPDIAAALANANDDAPIILLMHNPDLFPEMPSRVNLVLAGHTHGGQVRFPLFGAPIVPSTFGQRYARGYIEEGGRKMYVTTGIGTSILPVRFNVAPEIVILTLGATP